MENKITCRLFFSTQQFRFLFIRIFLQVKTVSNQYTIEFLSKDKLKRMTTQRVDLYNTHTSGRYSARVQYPNDLNEVGMCQFTT